MSFPTELHLSYTFLFGLKLQLAAGWLSLLEAFCDILGMMCQYIFSLALNNSTLLFLYM